MGTKRISFLNTYGGAFILGLGTFASSTPILTRSPTGQNELCLTPNCVRAAARVLNNLHPNHESIDPCENFEQCMRFSDPTLLHANQINTDVCGGFPSRWPNSETYTTLQEVGEINKDVLRSILEGSYPKNENVS